MESQFLTSTLWGEVGRAYPKERRGWYRSFGLRRHAAAPGARASLQADRT
ncbi:hypothetical protein [Paenibacillus sp. RC21]